MSDNPHIVLPRIRGFNKTSEAGDNTFAVSVFLFGCNLRCPYCMNAALVEVNDTRKLPEEIHIAEIHQHVKESHCEWIHISGGEPLLTPIDKLQNLLNLFASWGCKVGISTNGTKPEVLQQIAQLIHYVSLDYKSSLDRVYKDISLHQDRHISHIDTVLQTLQALRELKLQNEAFDYEIRTTLYPAFVHDREIRNIGEHLEPQEKWVLQQYRHVPDMLNHNVAASFVPYNRSKVSRLLEIAQRYVQKASVRSV